MSGFTTLETDALPADPPPELESRIVGYRRTPRDLYRALVLTVLSLLLLAQVLVARDEVVGLERDLLQLVTFLEGTGERIAVGLLQILVGASVLASWLVPLLTRRYRLFGYIALANATAGLLVWTAERLIDSDSAPALRNELAGRAGLGVDDFPTMTGLATLAAVFVVLGPFVGRRWRRAGAVVVAFSVGLRLVVSVELPSALFLSVAAGATVGALVLYAFGRPDERPTGQAVIAALRRARLPVATLDPADVDARGSTPYFGTFVDGSRFFAKVLGTEERSADLLFRLYRYLRFRNLGDERPFSSLRRAVEHEAFVSLHARDVGVRTPRLRAVADVGRDCLLLAYDLVDGATLDVLSDDLDDDLLEAIWRQVGMLREFRIAHRDLRRANVLVDRAGDPWLIDFGFAEVAASDALLAADVAQLLAALGVVVPPERVVSTGIATLGTDAVVGCLPRLQMAALSGATQSALKEHKGLLDELRNEIERQTGAEAAPLEPIQRVNGKQLFTVVMLVAVTYFLLPQFADLPEVWRNVQDADWWWFAPVVVASAATYFGATGSYLGSIPNRLRLVPTLATQVAASFVSKVAPAGLGGMALNIRYAQRSGVDPAVAVSGVGLNSAAGFLVHVALLGLFAVWAGRDAFGSFSLPNPKALAWGALVVAVFAVVMIAIPSVRALLRDRAFPILRRGLRSIGAIARSPSKLLLVVMGSTLVTMSYVAALFFATRAFGADLGFAKVGAIYLLGAAVATAAATPGGLGALEAALVAGLTAGGMPGPVALPSVFLMRLATFWLPILPGWLCFTWLRRTEHV
ncbi:MAG: hypothetical protein FJW88_13940 [Actinobacteria bacterium]|nr:hypothetical protein [Actinomycetota bacterium]